MADFDAGSIDATISVDRSPFTRGLELAKEQAAEFEDEGIHVRVELDDGDALVGMDDIEMRADELDGRDINMRVDVDTGEADAKLDETRAKADGGDGHGGLTLGFENLALSGEHLKTGLMTSGILTALGVLPGVLGAAGGAALGLGGALGVAAAGLVPFGLVAKQDFTSMQASLKDLTTQQQALNTATTDAQRTAALAAIAKDTQALAGPAGIAAKAFQTMEQAFSKVQKDTAPGTFGVMGQFFTIAANILPKLEPLINATSQALSGVAGQISLAFSSPGFTKFVSFISSEIGPVLSTLTSAFTSFGGGLAGALEKSAPLIDLVVKGISSFATTFESIANSPGFDGFISALEKDMPIIGTVLANIGSALVSVLIALEPSLKPAADIIDQLAGELSNLAPILGPLISSFLSLLDQALVPLLPVLTTLVTDLVPPLQGLLADIAPLLAPIATAFVDIVTAVLPLVPILGQLVTSLIPPLVTFVQALVKEGLAPLIQQLATSLAPVLPKIADSFSKVLIALTPLIPKLVDGLLPLIVKMAPQLPGLVGSLSNLAIAVLNIVTALPPGFFEQAFGALEPFTNPIFLSAMEQLANAITGILDATLGLAHEISGAQTDIHNFFANLGSNIIKDVDGAATWLLNTGTAILTGMWNGIYGYWTGTVLPWLKGLGTWIKNAIDGAITWLSQVGVDIVHGLWNGIDSAGTWLYNKIVGFVKDHVKSALTDPLAILSPSKWASENVGRNLVLGVAGGIDENAHLASASMTRLANTIKNGASGLTGTYSLTGNVAQTASASAQIAALSQVVAQLSQLVNVTKDMPTQTGQAVTDTLTPVLRQQTQDQHNNALIRGRQGAVGVSPSGS